MTHERDEGERLRALSSWSAELVGEPEVVLTRRPGGGRHEAWDVAAANGRRWFLRADNGPPSETEHYTLRREATIYRAVHRIGLPSPAVLGVHPTLEAVLLEHVEGGAAFARLDPARQTEIVDDFAPWLARLHAADSAGVELPGVELPGIGPAGTIEQHVRHELDLWEARLDASGVPDPLLSACYQWLRDNVPDTGDTLASLVQGDTGPGNFLHDGHRVTAFLDFELGHLGDPMEDLAWVGTRNAQEPVPDFERFLSRYAESAGAAPDRARIRYHFLFAELRIATLGAERTGGRADLEAEHGNQLIYGALHRRLTVEALAAVLDRPLPPAKLPTLADTADTRYFDGILHQIPTILVPSVADPYAARRLKSMARVVKYLREVDRAADTHAAAELDDLASVLGSRPDTIAGGEAALLDRVRARRIVAADLLAYAIGQVARRTQLVGPAMGVLATRHLPRI